MTTLLIVLDGWGHREESENNAIAAAHSPVWDRLWTEYPHCLLDTSGPAVGLPQGQMGNSEVGHSTIGAGRIIYQDLSRIDHAIADGSFATNPAVTRALESAQQGRLHVLGLLSPGGVHSHEDQIFALLDLASSMGIETFVHAFLDGRDTPPKSASSSLNRLDELCRLAGTVKCASICGRYYAMDRDSRWERTEKAYRMLTERVAEFEAPDSLSGLHDAYERGESDEFVSPTTIAGGKQIDDGDVVVFMNFRADRARQLSRALVLPDEPGFTRRRVIRPALFVPLTPYADELSENSQDIRVAIAFGPQTVINSIGEHLANLGFSQLRIAETEKFAHVTFFFSGREEPFPGEDRCIVPSPAVATYDLKPEMSAAEVTDNLVNVVSESKYDFIVCNFANGDMVGHTGSFSAAVQAVESIDRCLGRILSALDSSNSQCFITADHGNLESMVDGVTGQPLTAHTTNKVPFVYFGPLSVKLPGDGSLADVAPTILDSMDVCVPDEMTGRSLIRR